MEMIKLPQGTPAKILLHYLTVGDLWDDWDGEITFKVYKEDIIKV